MNQPDYCETQECFAIIGVRLYERLPTDCVEDADGRQLGEGERVFVAIEPISLCEEHRGERKPV